jgi:hypothetical protein
VIIVIGSAVYRPDPAGTGRAAGVAPDIAAAGAAAGAAVELLARIGEDGAGEELLLALARAGVGHLAILRDATRPTALAPAVAESLAETDDDDPIAALLAEAEVAAARPTDGPTPAPIPEAPVLEPADVSLGLRYLREFDVLVVVEPIAEGGAAAAVEAAAFAGATLVVVAPPGLPVPEAYDAATVIEAPADDPDGAFARLVGAYAAALDRGVAPGDAFQAAAEGGGWQVASD